MDLSFKDKQLAEQTEGQWVCVCGGDVPGRVSKTSDSPEGQKGVCLHIEPVSWFGFTQMLVAMGTSLHLILLQPLRKPDLRRHLVAASDTNRAGTTSSSKYKLPIPLCRELLFLPVSFPGSGLTVKVEEQQ